MNDRLTIAVPRGALFGGTLDLLDRLGVDTSEVRSNDRRLLFADVGIVTMAPEIDGGLELIRELVSHGHHVSLGHSGATYQQALEGIRAGA